jgi:hypothetical protein
VVFAAKGSGKAWMINQAAAVAGASSIRSLGVAVDQPVNQAAGASLLVGIGYEPRSTGPSEIRGYWASWMGSPASGHQLDSDKSRCRVFNTAACCRAVSQWASINALPTLLAAARTAAIAVPSRWPGLGSVRR